MVLSWFFLNDLSLNTLQPLINHTQIGPQVLFHRFLDIPRPRQVGSLPLILIIVKVYLRSSGQDWFGSLSRDFTHKAHRGCDRLH